MGQGGPCRLIAASRPSRASRSCSPRARQSRPRRRRAVILPPGFQQNTQIRNLVRPTDVEVAANGRVFVAEKSGIREDVHEPVRQLGDDGRGPAHRRCTTTRTADCSGSRSTPAIPANPYIYVYYTLDAPVGGTPPVFGAAGQDVDACPGDLDVVNCAVSARVSRLRVNGETIDGPEQVLAQRLVPAVRLPRRRRHRLRRGRLPVRVRRATGHAGEHGTTGSSAAPSTRAATLPARSAARWRRPPPRAAGCGHRTCARAATRSDSPAR